MNVQEALEKLLENCDMVNPRLDAADELAPIIEKALRAAYDEGATEHRLFGVQDLNNSHGIAAGIAAMTEGS